MGLPAHKSTVAGGRGHKGRNDGGGGIWRSPDHRWRALATLVNWTMPLAARAAAWTPSTSRRRRPNILISIAHGGWPELVYCH